MEKSLNITNSVLRLVHSSQIKTIKNQMKSSGVKKTILLSLLLINVLLSQAQFYEGGRHDTRVREYFPATRIIWNSSTNNTQIKNSKTLLNPGNSQADLVGNNVCTITNGENDTTSLLFDFGKEIHGGLELVTAQWKGKGTRKVRVRFGESVSEAMSELGGKSTAQNDHAIRDLVIELPWLGKKEIGNTGYRFVRIDFLDPNSTLLLKEVNAIAIYRDIPYLGSFESNDKLLNTIWQTGAYTVHLNMQEFLWDGIKRDRLVWIGDTHPEIMTINSVFGYNEVVPKSLDLIRDITPLPNWMNGISSYSMWWLMGHYDWYKYHGDLNYLKEQKSYIKALLSHLCTMVDEKGNEHLNGNRFLDWPSSPYPKAVDAGYHALLKITLERGAELSIALGDDTTASLCMDKVELMSKVRPDPVGSKQAAALLCLADILPEKEATGVLTDGGAKNFSTFYGYYMLQALAKSGEYKKSIDIIREYWGGMITLGATTFWEDFNLDWVNNVGRIDELPSADKNDIHADYGEYCYVGLRHSFCHGWASGPTAWLTEHVLGFKVLEPGCKKIRIQPNLGNLQWVKGSFPTPFGIVEVEHKRGEDGEIESIINAPKEIEVLK
jgi:hypothetical protein